MIDHVWSVVCSASVTDRATNNISLFNVIEQLNVRGEPAPGRAIHAVFEVVTLWVRSDPDIPARGRERIRILSPSGKELQTIEAEIDLAGYQRMRQTRGIRGFSVVEEGRHLILVELESHGAWCQVAVLPVQVVFTPLPATEQEPTSS